MIQTFSSSSQNVVKEMSHDRHHNVSGQKKLESRSHQIVNEIQQRYRSGQRNFEKVNFSGLNLQGIQLEGVNLAQAKLEGTNLEGANLTGANLKLANLTDCNLQGACLDKVDFRGANLTEADLDRASANEANFARATLTNVSFNETKLVKALLIKGVDLSGVYLIDADLSGADLSGADLSGAHLMGANFNGANLKETKFEKAYLEGAYYSSKTKFDLDFNPVSARMFKILNPLNENLEVGENKTTVLEFVDLFNSIRKCSCRYLGDVITAKYLKDSRPKIEWLETNFQINASKELAFGGEPTELLDCQKLEDLQQWINDFIGHCTQIIQNFSDFIPETVKERCTLLYLTFVTSQDDN
jgi:uncharacterized protein YjbI with pentapeptide repeats